MYVHICVFHIWYKGMSYLKSLNPMLFKNKAHVWSFKYIVFVYFQDVQDVRKMCARCVQGVDKMCARCAKDVWSFLCSPNLFDLPIPFKWFLEAMNLDDLWQICVMDLLIASPRQQDSNN